MNLFFSTKNFISATSGRINAAILLLSIIMTFSAESLYAQNGIQVYTKKEKGIEFVAKDSIFSTQFQFRMQNRLGYESVAMDDFTPESFEFRVRRLRLRMKGFIYNPKWTYHIQLSFS